MNLKPYMTPRNSLFAFAIVFFALVFATGVLLERKPVEIRPQSALVPTLQYLTTADLNDLRTAMINHSQQIADLRAANKGLAAELAARIEPLEAAMKSMQITTGSIPKGKK